MPRQKRQRRWSVGVVVAGCGGKTDRAAEFFERDLQALFEPCRYFSDYPDRAGRHADAVVHKLAVAGSELGGSGIRAKSERDYRSGGK